MWWPLFEAAGETEAQSQWVAHLGSGSSSSGEPRLTPAPPSLPLTLLYVSCVTSCSLFPPGPFTVRRRNLRQDGWSLTGRSCTAKFHHNMTLPVAPTVLKTFKWCIAAPLPHGTRRGLTWRECSLGSRKLQFFIHFQNLLKAFSFAFSLEPTTLINWTAASPAVQVKFGVSTNCAEVPSKEACRCGSPVTSGTAV